MRRAAWLLVATCLTATSCGDRSEVVLLTRKGRFGSLRDLVLFPSADGLDANALFVDRFEATRADWNDFAATPAGEAVGAGTISVGGDDSLPVAGIDLRQARAFAHWRFLRLPRRDEWLRAAVADGRSRYPWGSREDPLRANTGELGLGATTPVGTFESGRRGGGDQPYDLVGNVSEWTESVASSWRTNALEPTSAPQQGRRAALRSPALSVWTMPGGVLPSAWTVMTVGDHVPRMVVGSDFLSPMDRMVQNAFANDRQARTGLRACSTARELLERLLATPQSATDADLEQLRRFVRRGRHQDALVAAWRSLPEPIPGGVITQCLRVALAEPSAKPR